jgi:hypothetical protein
MPRTPDVEKRLKVAAITGFTAGEMEGNWQATEVGLQVNLGRETATRAAKRLIMLPPFAPAAETWARTTVESNICSNTIVQSSSVMAVSMVGPPKTDCPRVREKVVYCSRTKGSCGTAIELAFSRGSKPKVRDRDGIHLCGAR